MTARAIVVALVVFLVVAETAAAAEVRVLSAGAMKTMVTELSEGFQKETGHTVVITADTGGAAWTPDEGSTWYALSGVSGMWCVAFADPQHGWLVGRNGQITKISFQD